MSTGSGFTDQNFTGKLSGLDSSGALRQGVFDSEIIWWPYIHWRKASYYFGAQTRTKYFLWYRFRWANHQSGLNPGLSVRWAIFKGAFASSAPYVYTRVCVFCLIFQNIHFFNSSFCPELIHTNVAWWNNKLVPTFLVS